MRPWLLPFRNTSSGSRSPPLPPPHLSLSFHLLTSLRLWTACYYGLLHTWVSAICRNYQMVAPVFIENIRSARKQLGGKLKYYNGSTSSFDTSWNGRSRYQSFLQVQVTWMHMTAKLPQVLQKLCSMNICFTFSDWTSTNKYTKRFVETHSDYQVLCTLF